MPVKRKRSKPTPSTKKFHCSFYGVMPEMHEYLRNKLRGQSVAISSDELTLTTVDPETEILGVFVGSKVDAPTLKKLPHLKCIVTMSTGYDHIDLGIANKRRIPVCTVPSYGENTVAEHAMALLLALSRKLFPSVKRVKEGVYDWHGLRGFDLKGKTIGILGTGHIGTHMMEMCTGFHMNILAFDQFPKKELEATYGPIYTSLPKLLAQSDIISLHLPLLKETHHIINKHNIRLMKKGSYIINTARGSLIDPKALLWGLETGHIAGAGLDVLEDEQLIQHHELIMEHASERRLRYTLMNSLIIDHPNAIITPHNAFNSTEALQRIMDTTADNVKAFLIGNIQNAVSS